MKIIKLLDYTKKPGGRDTKGGVNSGELFYSEMLRPEFLAAIERREKLLVDLDNVEGYSTSFLNGSFGKLIQDFSRQLIDEFLVLKSDRDKYVLTQIERQFNNYRPQSNVAVA